MNRMKQSLLTLCATTVIALAGTQASATPILTFSPLNQTVDLGNTASVDVMVTGLSGEYVGTYDFSVNWDATLLSLQSLVFSDGLDGPLDSISGSVGGPGTVNAFEVSLGSLLNQDGVSPFKLFTLGFDTLAAGTSALTLAGNISPGNGFLGDALGELLQAETEAGSITINPRTTAVPEPGSLIMMLLAGCAIAVARRQWGRARLVSPPTAI